MTTGVMFGVMSCATTMPQLLVGQVVLGAGISQSNFENTLSIFERHVLAISDKNGFITIYLSPQFQQKDGADTRRTT